jgi:RND family efflux transporter MFP subunit
MKQALVSLSMLLVAACGAPPPPPSETAIVRTTIVAVTSSSLSRTYSGETHARYELPLSFRIGGKMLERKVDVGTHVVAGQTLALLDPADLALQVVQAKSQHALALADALRYRDLRDKNFVSQSALEAKDTTLRAAESQLGLANNQATYARLVADKPGVIAATLVEPGQVVAAGQAVVRVAQDGEREVAIALPESAVGKLSLGADATISLWSGSRSYRGRLRELAPAADAATRTFAARVSLLDPDPAVQLGMTASVAFNTPGLSALVIPLSAIFQKGDEAAVWLVGGDSVVTLMQIKVASYADGGALIAHGLVGGERIVTAGVHKLTAGQKVRLAQ